MRLQYLSAVAISVALLSTVDAKKKRKSNKRTSWKRAALKYTFKLDKKDTCEPLVAHQILPGLHTFKNAKTKAKYEWVEENHIIRCARVPQSALCKRNENSDFDASDFFDELVDSNVEAGGQKEPICDTSIPSSNCTTSDALVSDGGYAYTNYEGDDNDEGFNREVDYLMYDVFDEDNEFPLEYGKTCGHSSDTKEELGMEDAFRIFHGDGAQVEKFPWQVLILTCFNDRKCGLCGGSIISNQFVVTAAHCLVKEIGDKRVPVNFVRVYAGQTDFPDGFVRQPRKYKFKMAQAITTHEKYNKQMVNDIGLIKIKPGKTNGFTFDESTKPVCLPKSTLCLDKTSKVQVSGWGAPERGYDGTNIKRTKAESLRYTELEVAPLEHCQWKLMMDLLVPSKLYVSEEEICAGGRPVVKNGKTVYPDACQGDSGGPLSFKDADGIGTLAGLVSWGVGCGRKELPAVYTRITSYLSWIYRHSGVYMQDEDPNVLEKIKNGDTYLKFTCKDKVEQLDVGFAQDVSTMQTHSNVPCNICLQDENNQIKIGGAEPNTFCLSRNQRSYSTSFSDNVAVGHMKVANNCQDNDNINYSWYWDENTGLIKNAEPLEKEYCVALDTRNNHLTWRPCQQVENNPNSQWNYDPNTGLISSKQSDSYLNVWAYYPVHVRTSSEMDIKVIPLRPEYFKFESNKLKLDPVVSAAYYNGEDLCVITKRFYRGQYLDQWNAGRDQMKILLGPCSSRLSDWKTAWVGRGRTQIRSTQNGYCIGTPNPNGRTLNVYPCRSFRRHRFKNSLFGLQNHKIFNTHTRRNCINFNTDKNSGGFYDGYLTVCENRDTRFEWGN